MCEQKQTTHRFDHIVPLNSGNCPKNLLTGLFFVIVVAAESGYTNINMVEKKVSGYTKKYLILLKQWKRRPRHFEGCRKTFRERAKWDGQRLIIQAPFGLVSVYADRPRLMLFP